MTASNELPTHCPRCRTFVTAPICTKKSCQLDIRHETPGGRKKKGICTYCGIDNPERKDMSEEHVYGKWLKKQFPLLGTRHIQTIHRPDNYEFGKQTLHERVVEKKGNLFDLQVPHVCEECNNGWMSLAQRAAQDTVLKMASGDWPDLTEEERGALMRWAIMVAVNISAHLGHGMPHPEQLKFLREGGIPMGIKLSAIRVKDRKTTGSHHHHVIGTLMGGPNGEPLKVTMVLFFIEHVAFLVTHLPAGNMTFDLVRRYAATIGHLPRLLYPEVTPAVESEEIWISPDTLGAAALDWAV